MKNALDPVIRSAELQLGILLSTCDRTCRLEGWRYTIFHQPVSAASTFSSNPEV